MSVGDDVLDPTALSLGLSQEDFAELIVGGIDAWCALLKESAAKKQAGGTRPHRWNAQPQDE